MRGALPSSEGPGPVQGTWSCPARSPATLVRGHVSPALLLRQWNAFAINVEGEQLRSRGLAGRAAASGSARVSRRRCC